MATFTEWFATVDKVSWVLGVGAVLVAMSLRVQMIRFVLILLNRAWTRNPNPLWLKLFEKIVIQPLSWLLFILLCWFALYLLKLTSSSEVVTLLLFILLLPLMYSIIRLFKFLQIIIVRYYHWDRDTSVENYNRVVIVTEGLALIKMFLIGLILFFVYGPRVQLDSDKAFFLILFAIEVTVLLSSFWWMKNIVGGLILLIDEPFKKGSYISIEGNEGVVEEIFLRYFVLQCKDNSLAYIPNGMMLDTPVEVKDNESFESLRITFQMNLDRSTSFQLIRSFILEADVVLSNMFGFAEFSVSGLENSTGSIFRNSVRDLNRQQSTKIEQKGNPNYWICMSNLFVIDFVVLTKINSPVELVKKKSEIILRVMELAKAMNLKLKDFSSRRPPEIGDALINKKLNTVDEFGEDELENDGILQTELPLSSSHSELENDEILQTNLSLNSSYTEDDENELIEHISSTELRQRKNISSFKK